MIREALVNTILVASGEWLEALRRKDMVRAIQLRRDIDDLQMQLDLLNELMFDWNKTD